MKNLIKKILCVLTATLIPLSLAFTGCESTAEEKPDETTNEVPEENNNNNDGTSADSPKFKEFTVIKESEEIQHIYCRIYLPEETEITGNLPAVILSHSAAMTADSMNLYALGFAERGYAAIAFDFCGGSSSSRSDGAEKDMTVFSEIDDLKAVFAYVKSLDYIDRDKIYLFGTSQGGFVSALAANDMPDEIAGLILLYPAFNIPELAQKSGLAGGSFNIGNYLGNSGRLGFSFPDYGEDYINTLKDFDAFEHIADFKGKVLILHGSKDFIVRYTYSERAAEVYGENCTLHIINGAGHGFNGENYGNFFGTCDDEVWEWIDGFLGTE